MVYVGNMSPLARYVIHIRYKHDILRFTLVNSRKSGLLPLTLSMDFPLEFRCIIHCHEPPHITAVDYARVDEVWLKVAPMQKVELVKNSTRH